MKTNDPIAVYVILDVGAPEINDIFWLEPFEDVQLYNLMPHSKKYE